MNQPPGQWQIKQHELKQKLVLESPKNFDPKHIVGIDIALHNGTNTGVCTGVLLSYPDGKLIDQEIQEITITEQYVPGYLAFREVEFYIDVYRALQNRHTDLADHVVMTDGNGLLHPNNFGLACHLGVLLDVPTIGCGKSLHQYEHLVYNSKSLRAEMDLVKTNEMEILDKDGNKCGIAIRTNINPIYISQGHLVSLQDSIVITKALLKYREPEPVRLADRLSREYLRQHPI